MKLEKLFIGGNSPFPTYIKEWAEKLNIEVDSYEYEPNEDLIPDGLLLINENQDIRKDIDEIHSFFDRKHVPTQKIDINGTLQVAINSYNMWMNSYKCKNVLILGSDELVQNDNLNRFFEKIQGASISSAF